MWIAQTELGQTYLGVDILKICQSVLRIVGVPNVIFSYVLLTTSRRQNTVDKVGDSSSLVGLVLVIPLGSNLVGTVSRGKDIGYHVSFVSDVDLMRQAERNHAPYRPVASRSAIAIRTAFFGLLTSCLDA